MCLVILCHKFFLSMLRHPEQRSMDAPVLGSAQAEHGSLLLRQLERMRAAEELTDVVLMAEGIPFPCHKVVLSAFSPYFQVKRPCSCWELIVLIWENTRWCNLCFAELLKANLLMMLWDCNCILIHYFWFIPCVQAMFTCGLKETRGTEVPLRDTPAQSLELLLDYMYRAQLPLSNNNIQAVAAAAFLLHVDGAFRWANRLGLIIVPIN